MRDVDDPRDKATLEQQLQKEHQLLLHGYVQCRGWLVGDEQTRVEESRDHRNHTLPHASAQLVGITVQDPGREVELLKALACCRDRLFGAGSLIVRPHDVDNKVADARRRVQRVHGPLGEQTHHRAVPVGRHFSGMVEGQGHPVELDMPTQNPQRRPRHHGYCRGQRRLAAAGLPCDPQYFAFCHGQGDAVHCPDFGADAGSVVRTHIAGDHALPYPPLRTLRRVSAEGSGFRRCWIAAGTDRTRSG